MRKLRPMLLAAAVIAALAAPAIGQDESESDSEDRASSNIDNFVGTWRYQGSRQDAREIINRAVSETVAPMNFLTRGFAADRLRNKNPLAQQIEIEQAGENIRVTFDQNRTYESPPNEWRNQTFDGERLRFSARPRGDALVQLFRAEQGNRRNVFRLTGNDRMRLEVTVQSERLPRDMSYSLDYRRVDSSRPSVAQR